MTSLKLLLLGLSTLGYIKFISEKLRLGIGTAPFVYCCFVAAVLYFFGIVDLLMWGVVAVTILGVGLLGHSVLYARDPHFAFAQPAGLGIVFLILIGSIYSAIQENFQFLLWDEFSFWAASTRLIYTTDLLFKENSPIFFKSYPPIQQLFQYYILQFFSWSEKNTLFAHNIWLLSGVLCVASLPKAGVLTKIALFLSVATLLYAFGYSLSSLYSDALLGICFAAALTFAAKEARDTGVWLAFIFSLIVLILLKEIGILLALVATAVYTANLLFTPGNFTNEQPWMSFWSGIKAHWIRLLAICGVTLFVMQSWAWYVKSIGASRSISTPTISLWRDAAFQKRLSTTLDEFVRRTVEADFVSISAYFVERHPTILMVLVGLLTLSALSVRLAKAGRRLYCGVMIGIVCLGFCGYLAALLLSYLIVFTEYEGVRLASFERYLSTYLVAWASFVLVKLFDDSDAWRHRMGAVVALVCFLVLTAMTSGQLQKELRGIRSGGPDHSLRLDIESFAAEIKKHIYPGDKTYFVAQNSNGLERVMFYYAMLPNTVSTKWCWSLGQKYFDGDVWTCNQSLQELIGDFEYLALYRGDDQFWRNNKSYFDPTSTDDRRGLYKVDRKNGQILLKRVKLD